MAVDRKFVEKYPHVRPGPHVLLTVTEMRNGQKGDWASTLRNETTGGTGSQPTDDRPGVDLGVLQGLVNECGGHLWMMAEPPGDMVLRIHLPRRVLDDRKPAKRSGRARWIDRLSGVRH